MNRKRIAIAGFQHETNTFAPGRAGVHEFTIADSWPGLLRGDALINDTRDLNIPISGAIATAENHDLELLPILWCAAEPSGPVTSEAYEWIVADILTAIADADALDGIYLDLHGAMVTERYDDGEAELLRRLRSGPAADIPIAISLDLHANLSNALAQHATLVSIFRSYPHLDMAATGARCMQRLIKVLEGNPTHNAFRQSPFLVPLHAQYTEQQPCKQLYRQLRVTADETQREYLELAMGFSAADIADCGPSIIAAAPTEERAQALADEMQQAFVDSEVQFDTGLHSATQAVQIALANDTEKPIVIADVQDNAGAGGTADTTGLLQALIDQRASAAVIGVICDAEVAELAHAHGTGRSFRAALGAKSGLPGHKPVTAQWQVMALSDGQITYSGEMYGGVTASIGKCCLLSVCDEQTDVQVVVSSCRTQCLDQALFTHLGITLQHKRIIVVKSTVHFRADFETLAARVINAAAPGAFECDLATVNYRHLRDGLRLGPLGKPFNSRIKSTE